MQFSGFVKQLPLQSLRSTSLARAVSIYGSTSLHSQPEPLPPVYRYLFSRMEASEIQRDVAS